MKYIFGVELPKTHFISTEITQKTTYDDFVTRSNFSPIRKPDWKFAFPFPGFQYAFPEGRHSCFNWFHQLNGSTENLIATCSIKGWEKICHSDLYCWGITPESIASSVKMSWRYPAVLLGIGRCICLIELYETQLIAVREKVLTGFVPAQGVTERDYVSDFLYWVHDNDSRVKMTQREAVVALHTLVTALDKYCPQHGWHWVDEKRWSMLKQWISARYIVFCHHT
jgi:hypothetical protein